MLGGWCGANLTAMGTLSITARRIGQPLRIAAWVVGEAGVAYQSPTFEASALLLNASQRASFNGVVLVVENGGEFREEETLTFK